MENNLRYFGPRELGSIFDFLATQLSEVIWICTNDYKRQLYTSPQFDKAWGFSRDVLYEHRDIWPTTLFEEDVKRIVNSFQQRQQKDTNPVIAFRIRKPNGETEFIKDKSYGICDKNGNQVAQMGTAKVLTATEWEELANNNFQEINPSPSIMLPELKNVIADNLQLNIAPQKIVPLEQKPTFYIIINRQGIRLTFTEARCLYYLFQSYSAKLIAREFDVSVRTIESHIDNIKAKVNCRRVIELLNKIQNRHQVENWKF